CVTRFRGGALRHAKFPKTSYCLQLLDTLKHGRCVGQNRSCGRGLIFLSGIVLVPFWQNASVLLVLIKTLLPSHKCDTSLAEGGKARKSFLALPLLITETRRRRISLQSNFITK
ncbi:MAG TPA: hypothetical protein DEQ88_00115, partial [Clostridiales bacterium]|nr:hypothetical protein [Clostridiales bacterium]